MKRRQFIQSIAASAAATTLPLQAFSANAASVTYGMDPYKWAKYTARINKKLTPEMLKNFLGFSDADATGMIKRLTAENVLMTPDPTGLSRTNTDYLDQFKKGREAVKKLIKTMDDLTTDTPQDHDTLEQLETD